MYIVKYLYSYIYIYTGSKICPGAKLNSPASKRRRSEKKRPGRNDFERGYPFNIQLSPAIHFRYSIPWNYSTASHPLKGSRWKAPRTLAPR